VHQLLEKVIIRITFYSILSFISCFSVASNQSAISATAVADMTRGVISYSYDITDGTESSAPRLQATLQFNESADIDEVIFILRSNAGTSRLHRIANFSAANSGSNTWTLDEPLSATANGSYEYYLNFAYKSGENGSDFNGMSSMPGDGTKWANLIPAFAAEDNGYLSLPDPRITFSNPGADTEDPSFSHYISSIEGSDPSETFNSAQDAALITGNDGDPNTPIIVKLKAVFSEPVAYATDLTYVYPEEGSSYSSYNDSSIQIDGSTVTYTWTFDSKIPIYRLRPYLFAYDYGLNRTYKRDTVEFTNILADTSQPTLQSISIVGRVGENQEKYIDYDLQFDSTDVGTENMKEIGISYRGPNCNSLYTRFHDYNPDSSLLPGQYKGSWRILDNNPYGIYRISTSLYVHDQQLNRAFYPPDELINDFSIRNFSFQETVNGQQISVPTIFCPTYGNQFGRVYFATNSDNIVASYENTIQDGEGNVVTPRFGLSGDDADLFNFSASGVITFKSPPDYENPLDADANNDYELVTHIYASDSSDPDYVSDDNHKIDDSFTVRVDSDSDSDGVADTIDLFPSDASESVDTDGDGIGNNADPDDDNDGTADAFDAFPLDSTEFLDTDADGIGDNADTDDDNDGTLDTQDIFPIDDYQTALLDSDLATSPFGIVGFSASAVEDPSIILGFTPRNFSLSALGYYLESGQSTDVGIWSGIGQGYELSETINTNKTYPTFNDQNDLTSTFKAEGYTNINFSALASSQSISAQYEVIYKTTFRLAVIEKGSEVWTLAFQTVYDEYATNATYPIAIDTSKPIRSSISSVGTYTILSPDREIPAFTSSELIGTWMIGGINEDDMTLAPRCKEESNDGLVCADLVTLNADGTGSTQMSNRSLNWSVINDGSLRLTFSDNNTVFSVRQIEKNVETISTLVSGVANSKYFARTQLMVKQQDAVPQLGDLLLGETLASGFYVTYPGYLRSSVDNRLIEFFGFMLNADGTGTRIFEYASSTVMVDGVSVVTGVTNYSREITWSYDPDGPRKLVSKVCFSYNPLPDNFNWDDCGNLQTRTWNIVSTTSTRLYVLETIQYDFDSTGDGVLDYNGYFITRPNFYEVRTYDANDVDGDGYANDIDVFPVDATDWLDFDGDGIGDNADTDDDNDGVADGSDAFPSDASESVDTDGDGIGNNADPDDDNDGVLDNEDTFPLDANESIDTDSDGIGDNADTDDDNDGVPDESDTFPSDASESVDTDGDSIGNNADPDDDNDGTADAFDAFPLDSTEFLDTDSDGIGGNADTDDDNDGIPDSQDLYPFVDYQTALLASDLSSSPFGIINYKKSAIEDPSVQMGYVAMSFSLSPLGFYFESGKSTTLGNWSSLAEGYLLSETINSPVYKLTFGSGDYQNFNWSGLGLSPGDTIGASGQFEVVYRNTFRLAVIEKGSDIWKIAYQRIISTYATNTDFNVAINKNLPIKIERGDITEFDILAPDRATVPFDNSEISGTWAIGGILEDDLSLASDCLSDGYSCGDLVTFNADGSAEALRSSRSLTWMLQQDGSVRLSFIDNGSVFFLRRLAKDNETSSVLVSGAVNEKYFSQIQLMIKRQDAAPSVSDLLLNKYLVNGFTVTSTDSVRSPVDNKVVDFFGFNLYDVGNGKRVQVYTPDGITPIEGGYADSRDITWTYADGILEIELCYYTSTNSEGTEVCGQRQYRTWKLVSVTDSRMYVLEILKFELDADLDGIYETLLYSFSRPNFYEWHTTFSLGDYDRDGVLNDDDLFPYDGSDWADLDGDGVGDNADSDTDGDGVDNVSDAFPRDPSETLDTDDDGIGNSADTDDDNDGVSDTWTVAQLGSDIDGEAANDLASRIALSGDGTTLAVGSWGANSYTGFVRIFKWNASSASWIQHGSTIYGENQYDYTGYSISLSHDGSVVAIDASGGYDPTNEAGYVRIFAWDGQDWSQRGNKIEGEFAGDACCYLSLSADGATIAVASQKSKGSANLTDIGQTRVFSWDGTNWSQKGLDIDGEAENDRSGRWATSLSADGLSLAIGARNNEGNGPDFSGHVRVYKWTDSAWVQRGQDIDGEAGGDYSGNSASLSSDGSLVVIGAPGNDGSGPNAGHVRIYGWSDSSSTWIQKGQDIDGNSSVCDDSQEYTDTDADGITDSCGEESGWASDLSSDGSTLAIGAWKNDDNGEDSGTTRIYGWDEPSQIWVQRADDIDGEAAGDHSGYQTAVSSDGSVIATSAWGNTGASGYMEAGHVRVFKLSGPADAFPLDATETIDTDSDGIGNNSDTDDDGDGVEDANDSLPLDPTNDSDGDGVANIDDVYPENSLYSKDSDLDGMPDAWETQFGLDPNDASDASSDRDNDGYTALEEFLNGTIPSGSIDIDGNERYDALTDGLLILRSMFGLDGSSLTAGTAASDAVFSDSDELIARINTLGDLADIDGSGDIDALTDGLLILRYLFGLEGETLVAGVVSDEATRTTEEIEAHLEALMPSL
jgi:hypothetical protein